MRSRTNAAIVVLLASSSAFGGDGLVATRQVSTLDVAPLLYAQAEEGDPYFPVFFDLPVIYNRLYTPAADNGRIAFAASSDFGGFDNTTQFQSATYMIEDLTPNLDGSTNTNVLDLGHGRFEVTAGLHANLARPGDVLAHDYYANSLQLSGSELTFFAYLDGGPSSENFRGALCMLQTQPSTPMSLPLDPLGVVIDSEEELLPGFKVFDFSNFAESGAGDPFQWDTHAFAVDGDRIVAAIELEDGVSTRDVLITDVNGVRTTHLVSNGAGSIPIMSGVPFRGTRYLDADGGRFAFIDGRPSEAGAVYLFDETGTPSEEISSSDHLALLALDGDDLVVGREPQGGLLPINPVIEGSRARLQGGLFVGGNGVRRISKIEDGAFVDLLNPDTPAPGASTTFNRFGIFSLSDGNLAFLGVTEGPDPVAGLYVLYKGTVQKVLAIGDEFDGMTVLEVDINRHGLSGDLLAFTVRFDFDNGDPDTFTQSIYTMSLSENFASGCSTADLAEPFGVLDFSDVLAFLTAFGAMAPEADLADPVGVFDFSDVLAFLGAIGAGCP